MKQRIYLINLYDYYGNLLTDKQKDYFTDYYFDNLTLAEIAENNNISRNAIHKTLKEVENKLLFYEDKLKLYEKNKRIRKLIEEIDDKVKEEIINLI